MSSLFDVLKKTSGIQPSDALEWITNGLLVGASKEMRQSTAIAHQVAYTILVDVILEIQDDDIRANAWTANFVPRLRQYLNSEAAARGSEANMIGAFASALVRISRGCPTDFEKLWIKECEWLIGLISSLPSPSYSETRFKTVFPRWTDLIVLILCQFIGQHYRGQLEHEASVFLKITARPLEEAISAILKSAGVCIDEMSFVAGLVETAPFSECLSDADEMQNTREALKSLLSSDSIVKLVHSASFVPYIRVVLAFCRTYRKQEPQAWEHVVKEAIPEDQLVGVQNPESLFCQLVSIVSPSSRAYLRAPSGINANLVREMSSALASNDDPESEEMNRLERLLVSVVDLRGTS